MTVSMTRQHFEALAHLAGALIEDLGADRDTANRIVKRFADLGASSNGRFDRGRFERVALGTRARLGWDPLAAAPAPVQAACGYLVPDDLSGALEALEAAPA